MQHKQGKEGTAADLMAAIAAMGDRINGRDVTGLKYKRISKDAFAPRYSSDGAACFDLMAMDADVVRQGDAMIFGTGLAFEVPPTHVMLVFSRSGHGFNNDVRLANCVGVIDSDYRGEVMVKLRNDGDENFTVRAGDRIAQAMLVPIPAVALVEVDELSTTVRGASGFGSTGN